MTRYEQLKEKAYRCRKASIRTIGFISFVWLQKAVELEALAESLPVTRANEEVTNG